MNFLQVDNYQKLSEVAANWLAKRIQNNPKLKIGIATGQSPKEMYRIVARNNDVDASQVYLFQLDEWIGISEYSNTCRAYIEKEICGPWNVPSQNFFAFTKTSEVLLEHNGHKSIEAMQQIIDDKGPLDVLILGFGKNGHIGFIEPSDTWASDACFISTLDKITQKHAMIASENKLSDIGVTMGLKTIKEAKEILFLITGNQKEESYKRWLTKEVSPRIPASILWEHPNVIVITDLEILA